VCAALRNFAVSEEGVPVSMLPAAVLLVPPFSREDGTLTISQKVARPGVKKLYRERLTAMHKDIADARAGITTNNNTSDDAASGSVSRGESVGMGDISPSGMIMMPSIVDNTTGVVVRHRRKVLAAPRFLVLHAFREVLAGIAEIPKDIRDVSVDDKTAVSLGADSIMIGTLREKVCNTSGASIALRDFGVMPIKAIIARVQEAQTGVPASATADAADAAFESGPAGAPASRKMSADELRELLKRSCVVSTTPSDAAAAADVPVSGRAERNYANGSALVTGATGFIGIALLDALIKHSPGAVHFAVVRGANGTAALQRLQKAAMSYRLPAVKDAVAQGRIRVLLGDLVCKDDAEAATALRLDLVPAPAAASQQDDAAGAAAAAAANNSVPTLLDPEHWQRSVGRVFLMGANVNHYLPPEQLIGTNVKSNERVLRAVAAPDLQPPSVIYASTASVTGPNYIMPSPQQWNGGSGGGEGRALPELSTEVLSRGSGYVISKWAAEHLMDSMAAAQQPHQGGGPLAHPQHSRIVRIGMCSWSCDTGAANTQDWLVSLTQAVALTRHNPFPTFNMNLVPVVWLCQEILRAGTPSASSASSQHGAGVPIVRLAECLNIDMSSQVWDKLTTPATQGPVKVSWPAFLDHLGALSRAGGADGADASSLADTARRCRTRLELLFGETRMPGGDGGAAAARVDNTGDKLGIDKFCEFVRNQ
jgi:thioester reductase-like protein